MVKNVCVKKKQKLVKYTKNTKEYGNYKYVLNGCLKMKKKLLLSRENIGQTKWSKHF